jgi:hypothetical protein
MMMRRRKRIEPKMGLGTDMIISLLMAVVLLSVMITEEVYAQQQQQQQQQQQEVVNGTYLHQYVLDDLQNAELISVQVFQDGRMILVFKLSDESEKRMVIRTQSPLTPEAGYQWDNGTIYTKEGSKLVFELEGRGRNR